MKGAMNGRFSAVLLASSLGLGCAPRAEIGPVGRSASAAPAPAEPEPEASPKPRAEAPEPPPDDVVLRAALPFRGVRMADGTELEKQAFLSELARADAICVGERHDAPHDHWAQLATIEGLAARREIVGFELGVGLEMFQHPAQPVLDAFTSGRIELDRLVRETDYEQRWGFPIQFYAPQLTAARNAGASLLALNASTELTRAIGREGLAALPPDLAGELPELDLEDADHRALFDVLTEGHPGHASPDDMYAAQVVWDESMATRAADWLANRAPARKLVILAGRAHCARSAIPSRIERRGPFRAISVLPEVASGNPPERSDDTAPQANTESAPSEAEAALRSGYDYRFVMYHP